MMTMDNGRTWNQFRLHLPTQRINGESDNTHPLPFCAWWRHQMETFSALLAICAGNSPVPGEFPTQRPVTRSFDIYFDLRPNKRLSKQWWGLWFETQLCPLWCHRNVFSMKAEACVCVCMCVCVRVIYTTLSYRQPRKSFLWKHIC